MEDTWCIRLRLNCSSSVCFGKLKMLYFLTIRTSGKDRTKYVNFAQDSIIDNKEQCFACFIWTQRLLGWKGLVNKLHYKSGRNVFLGVGSQSNWSGCTPSLLHHSWHLQSHLGWPGKINEQIIDEDMVKWAAFLLFATQQEKWLL